MTDDEKAAVMADTFRPFADLNRLPCIAPEVVSEVEHFIICGECGQAIDCRNLGDVCHHEVPGHAPLRSS